MLCIFPIFKGFRLYILYIDFRYLAWYTTQNSKEREDTHACHKVYGQIADPADRLPDGADRIQRI